ncbi:MAG TPA: hypothetical protein VFC19_03975 [Candidatus Limnocylindrales bacterium]|nr:hypothetical protein [Candidatus Limnocylindrales bacterium]
MSCCSKRALPSAGFAEKGGDLFSMEPGRVIGSFTETVLEFVATMLLVWLW